MITTTYTVHCLHIVLINIMYVPIVFINIKVCVLKDMQAVYVIIRYCILYLSI